MSRRLSLLAQRTAIVLALGLFLAPVLWLIMTAYEPSRAIQSTPPLLWFKPSFANFASIASNFDLSRLTLSSVVLSAGSTLLSLCFGIPCGYALARTRSRSAVIIAYALLAIRGVPTVVTLIPFYLFMQRLGLLGTWWAVILMNATLSTAFVTWMMFSAFQAVPPEIEAAATLDGCTSFGAFRRVALPLVQTSVIAAALLCMMFAWNDFLNPAFLTRAETRPLSVALLTAFGGNTTSGWGNLGAMAHLSTLPIIAVALLLNRYLVSGLTRGIH
ncbi:carbohydrate ABC transporter permease [Acidisoma cellulosilytica]|uniref:Carbohydrate ABC transporter permease n=1 Tax=Acidisoma cellulosilyticum TaxID=2802395 RepID=A0A964E581_9PROT|nr:carbohydrate ABC transporter permease [Acidisoma cellulosilyticum]MCB8882137.1 carbohydrate ABC transporter permease [Acidisoma cellulosilyticum]